MRFSFTLTFIFLFTTFQSLAQFQLSEIRVEHQLEPNALGVMQPRFSWKIANIQRNIIQSAYEIHVKQAGRRVWTSGKVRSSQSLFIPYAGEALQSDTRYDVQVRIWDARDLASDVKSTFFITTLLQNSDWNRAQWINAGLASDTTNGNVPVLFKDFNVKRKKVRKASLFITARGMYEASINGKRVGDAYLSPGWTSYLKHHQFQTYDVSQHLRSGQNQCRVLLGSGWYRSTLGWANSKNYYGDKTALLAILKIVYVDGSVEEVPTDASWQSNESHITYAEIYNGENQDLRKRQSSLLPHAVHVMDFPKQSLVAAINEPIKIQQIRAPKQIKDLGNGAYLLDFGQNLVGWLRLKIKAPVGKAIRIRHVEMLDKKGNPYFENLRTAKAEANYLADGDAEVWHEPHFSFFGFRYAVVEGIDALNASDVQAVVLHSDMKVNGRFESSDPLINQLQSNIVWGQKGNFLDVPTDCPQRDERLGWTGDAEVFFRTAAFNFETNAFFSKWLKDVAADQFDNGAVPFVVPDVLNKRNPNGPNKGEGAAGWSDASIIIPYQAYVVYGDRGLLERQYPSMKAYMTYVQDRAPHDLWDKGFQFGDWLSYRVDDSKGMIGMKSAITDNHLVAQCFYAYNLQLMIKTAEVLGLEQDLKNYQIRLQRVKQAFQNEYLTPNGRLLSETQTAYALALAFDLVPKHLVGDIVQRLESNVQSYQYHLTTGFLGTPFLNPVLSQFGKWQTAYRLLKQDTYPSWLYPIKSHGATTIWERWDSMKPDSTFQDPAMTSFNHYAYGAIGDWMYRNIGGLDTEEGSGVAYKRSRIRPMPGGGIHWANTSLETPYGTLACDWKMDKTSYQSKVVIPANTTSKVYLPSASGQCLLDNQIIKTSIKDDLGSFLELGSGAYQINCSLNL